MNERYALRVITPPPFEPISLEEAKRFLNIDDDITNRNDDIEAMIAAAREWIEGFTGLAMVMQTLEMSLDAYPSCGYLELPRSPVISVDSIKYTDSSGAEQTWDAVNYQTDIVMVPGRIGIAYGGSVPSTWRSAFGAWRIRFTAGHQVGSPDDADGYRANVPNLAKLAMKVHVTGSNEGTLDTMIKTAENLARPLRTSIL